LYNNYFLIGSKDYVIGPYVVIFPAGMTTILFDAHIKDDEILERNEIFQLIIKSNSLPNGVTIDNPTEATVTIVDNDCKFCK